MRIGILTLMLVAGALSIRPGMALAQRATARVPLARAMQGAWVLAWPEKPEHEREVKLITPHHFSWTTWDTRTHEVLASAGGAWTLAGSDYCEQLSFAQGGMAGMGGKVMCFEVRVSGDTLVQMGHASEDGSRSREIWKRLR